MDLNLNRKAIVSEDGQSLIVMSGGLEYMITHGARCWFAHAHGGYLGMGPDIWSAITDAERIDRIIRDAELVG